MQKSEDQLDENSFSTPEKLDLLSRGAEAEIWLGKWFDREIVIKKRIKKGYRHPQLDQQLRKQRVKKEARLIREARKMGVPVPIIYDLKIEATSLILEYFPGMRVMDAIKKDIDLDLVTIGEFIGRIHSAGITHGDLTTSNILYDEEKERYCFIDFSLGEEPSSIETMGVDMHLMREALISVHDGPLELYQDILSGYKNTYAEADRVIKKVKKIEERGRYQ